MHACYSRGLIILTPKWVSRLLSTLYDDHESNEYENA